MAANSGDIFGVSAPAATKELKQERAVRTRERVLASAATAFAAKGYPAVTILDVAQSAGMTKGAVYFHYENKDALAVAVTELFNRRIGEIARAVEELGLPPVSAVAELLIRTAVAFRDETALQAGARLQLERQLIGAQIPLPYEGYTDLITSWLAKEVPARPTGAAPPGGDGPAADPGGPGRADDATAALASPTTLATVLVSAFFGAQHISWVLNNRADLPERTIAVVRAIIPCAEEDIELCPSAPRG
ncbi:TetR/AcrR family transcriptional regulator [Streptomyces showdoensis]|uniref:TetR family transcriptional regulator n=1 Tax=Streptomyces showdoensis TaxID=68268 RepID=A0A2P2GEY1_STREW|nr:TetR/AcrR family transcriptional regulator [Streptomyces showdoensis]KKZ70080.1 TetR family transcriptional regulator [Streptomyces showdoensis]